ncbi:substrate-binding domain-containing protein [Vreelandella malpeensis]|uniref:Substrate-binding domain-containing protein n=1 Tax=Vreelandella malpeensis TaxID=1172368 RepID=A0ABS8DWF2_9GAMM|nr:substrate-binding domain-containing protein [Halomonas malpeensis]MCB8890573.1 substrate-binding domain-containing protein [Halomonas malpeensis]
MTQRALLAAATLTGALASATALAQQPPTIAVVAKVGGIPWFNAMEKGIEQMGEELGVEAYMVGPTSADPALQVRAIEDLISRGVDVIGVVPNDREVLEPVLERARSQGIIVLTHESPESVNIDYDFEMISAQQLGEEHARLMADTTGCEGSYAVYVGGLSVPAHNAWADAAVNWLEENCQGLTPAAERFGVAESVDDSRSTTLDLLRAHEDLAGIMSFGSQGTIGAARAVKERGLAGDVAVVGLFSPGQGRRLVHEGVITGGFQWSPLEAGQAFVALGNLLYEGGEVSDGDALPVLGEITLDGHTIFAAKPVELNADSVDALAELGL